MEKTKWSPPFFLGVDTSYQQMKKVPFLNLGIPRLDSRPKTYVASFRSNDISGNQLPCKTSKR